MVYHGEGVQGEDKLPSAGRGGLHGHRRGAEEVKTALLKETDPLDVRVATATSHLDELANDPNIPLHGRTLIWNIMSRLEELA